MSSWLDACSVDGPGLADFIEARTPKHVPPNEARYLRYWRTGTRPSYFEADRVLIRLGLHPSEVPDRLWLDEEPTPVYTVDCIQCGGPILGSKRRRWRVAYCSPQCIAAAREGAEVPTKLCENCGRIYERPAGLSGPKWDLRRYCTEACRREADKWQRAVVA
jgi:hypothetical protein